MDELLLQLKEKKITCRERHQLENFILKVKGSESYELLNEGVRKETAVGDNSRGIQQLLGIRGREFATKVLIFVLT